jgi:DNA topoisomerase-1
MSKLIIVESPGKIKKIKSYLDSSYNVMASIGHIRDLSKSYNAIDYNNKFTPKYEILKDKIKVVNNLKTACKKAKEIYIASDGDREGEAIAYHLVETLKIKKYKRIVFNEITKDAISNAITNPRKIDMDMFYSQQTRRILDRIVGYKLSPILKRIEDIKTKSLGAGRVQSVVTRLIVDKEIEINNFINDIKDSIYNVSGNFTINKKVFKASYEHYKLIELDYKISKNNHINIYDFVKDNIKTKSDIDTLILNIKLDPIFKIFNINKIERNRNPPQPFTTSTLQQEASYKLKFSLKTTMQVAQKLYEKGLITYMRTDSPNLSKQSLIEIKNFISKDYGDNYYQYRQFKSKSSNAQEAHEAIRPTNINIIKIDNIDEQKLYSLIWKRTVASQMKPAKYHDQNIIIKNSLDIKFKCTNSELIFDGYLKLYKTEILNSDSIVFNKNSKISWSTIDIKESYTNPSLRYNEASLVKKLEELGIGRPSTYANIISKIQEHEYIKITNIKGIEKNINNYILKNNLKLINKITKQNIGNEQSKFIPTEDGIKVTNFLIKNFPDILDYKFTTNMELSLDNIANGDIIWYEVLNKFYNIFKNQLYKIKF